MSVWSYDNYVIYMFDRIFDNYAMCVGHIIDNCAMYVWAYN
jgi:hypothetical protein